MPALWPIRRRVEQLPPTEGNRFSLTSFERLSERTEAHEWPGHAEVPETDAVEEHRDRSNGISKVGGKAMGELETRCPEVESESAVTGSHVDEHPTVTGAYHRVGQYPARRFRVLGLQ